MAENKIEALNNLQQQNAEEIWTAIKTAPKTEFPSLYSSRKLALRKAYLGSLKK